MDMGKNQVTVTGTMDANARPCPRSCGAPKDGCGGGGKEKDGKDSATKALTAELEAWKWKVAFYDQQSLINAKFMLSDENPNACAVM
jgi:hypothetical protein